MPVVMALTGVAVLLGAGLVAVALQRLPGISRLVYFVCLVACLAILGVAVLAAAGRAPAPAPALHLPVGLPWIGAHFRMDALAALFLAVVNLGGAGASLFALGYGRHETAPGRVLPFYPAFLGGMNLVVLADDAFTFLVAWEFMSLSSWALVMAHHHDRREPARRLHLHHDGELRHAGAAAGLRPARGPRRRLRASPTWPASPRRLGCPASSCCWCCWAPAPRPAWCRCTCGCRSPIRRRPATSPP